MPLTKPISPNVQFVIDIIRQEVEIPELPDFINGLLRWHDEQLSFSKCAMGLCPRATHNLPVSPKEFPYDGIKNSHVTDFIDWFDSQNDPQAVVDAIWDSNGVGLNNLETANGTNG